MFVRSVTHFWMEMHRYRMMIGGVEPAPVPLYTLKVLQAACDQGLTSVDRNCFSSSFIILIQFRAECQEVLYCHCVKILCCLYLCPSYSSFNVILSSQKNSPIFINSLNVNSLTAYYYVFMPIRL